MLKKTLFALLVAASVAMPAAAHAEEAAKDAAAEAETAQSAISEAAQDAVEGRMLLSQELPHDIVYGDEKALVTITEYASLSCSHCRDFYTDVFSKLKENYIDTGKARLVFRHYPLNLNALRGAMVLECGIADPEKKRTFLGAMFQSQPEWAYKEDEADVLKKLKSIAKLGGIDDSKFDECAKNKELEEKLLRQQLLTQKALGVSATPTLYINSTKYFDKKDYESFAKAVDDAIANFGKEEEAAAEVPAGEAKE